LFLADVAQLIDVLAGADADVDIHLLHHGQAGDVAHTGPEFAIAAFTDDTFGLRIAEDYEGNGTRIEHGPGHLLCEMNTVEAGKFYHHVLPRLRTGGVSDDLVGQILVA